ICAERCGGSFTSVPSARISPSTSPRGVNVYCFTRPRDSGSCDESQTAPGVCEWALATAPTAVAARNAHASARIRVVVIFIIKLLSNGDLVAGAKGSARGVPKPKCLFVKELAEDAAVQSSSFPTEGVGLPDASPPVRP